METIERFKNINDKQELEQVANLLLSTDDFLFTFFFGQKLAAISKITTLIQGTYNTFAHTFTHIYIQAGQIAGIAILYDPKKIDQNAQNREYKSSFTGFELLVLGFKQLLIRNLENKQEVDGMYLQNLSVDSKVRGRGIGTKLLNYSMDFAKVEGYKSIWLDVSLDNPRAQKLYEKYGFKKVSKKRLIPFTNISVYRMKLDI